VNTRAFVTSPLARILCGLAMVVAGSGVSLAGKDRGGPAAVEGAMPVTPETVARDAEGRVTVRAVRIDAPPVVDGHLDEELYRLTRPIDGFLQQEPKEGAPATHDLDPNVGVDVKYGITQGLTTDFSVNTDFAQVEEDEQQVNLTRFSLFFPERRDFFLEGQGIFGFGGAGGSPGVVAAAKGRRTRRSCSTADASGCRKARPFRCAMARG
jgi:hypothetical protein